MGFCTERSDLFPLLVDDYDDALLGAQGADSRDIVRSETISAVLVIGA
ncbi:hypothetical protein [Thiocapsa bogorovii]|nr:hypothetical protein [Thiocapsa bogorovii]UHD17071.1 hypothetical protein LT988_03160 [Thiocapsa bogorovii]